MRRIKSAPANICMMCHNKLTKTKEVVSTLVNTNKSDNIEDIKKESVKKQKSILNTSSNIIGDVISDSNSLSLQENYFIVLIASFISENIIKKNNLKLEQINTYSDDYARTLATWRENFLGVWEKISPLGFDDYFKRMWEFYLSYCEGGFKSKNINLIQFSMSNRYSS